MSGAPRRARIKVDGEAGQTVLFEHGLDTLSVIATVHNARGEMLTGLIPDVRDRNTVAVAFIRDVPGAIVTVIA